MSWYSYNIALFISQDSALDEIDSSVLSKSPEMGDEFFFTSSRNDCLLWQLEKICALASHGKNLYLLKKFCAQNSEAIAMSAAQIEALLIEIEQDPNLVVEATKSAYRPTLTLSTEGYQPLECEVVYPENVLIKDGWVYKHTEEQILKLLKESSASPVLTEMTMANRCSLCLIF